MAGVTFKNVYKIYSGDVTAVEDFNLEIKDKEFVVLVGPSGCGKSTTLRMVAGLEEISRGEIYIEDRLINNISPKDRDIAMVFQNYALYPHMTVYDNMAFSLTLRKVSKKDIETKVNEAARILGIEDLLKRKPKALSGGQRQRVALGRAIVRKPKVFLMDEPLSNLDAKLRVQTRTEITKLHNELETTFIYVTHDQTEAMTMGDRIVVMKDGLIQQVDTPKEIYEKPANVFVAGFIGSPQMNFINVMIEGDVNNCSLVFGDTRIALPLDKAKKVKEKGYLGKKAIMGIRPEDIHYEPTFIQLSKDSLVYAKIEIAEMMGSEVYLHFTLNDISFIARVDSRSKIKRDEIIRLAFDKNRIHLFDIETEKEIM